MKRLVGVLVVALACVALAPAQQPQVRTVGSVGTGTSAPVASPNGRFLAYHTRDSLSLQVMEVASGRRWTVLRGNFQFVDWSPNGDMLAFSRDDDEQKTDFIWTLPMNPITGLPSGEARRVSMNGGDVVAFSPDGQLIAFADYQNWPAQRIVVVPARGGRERVLAETGVGLNSIAWSSDGRWIYYAYIGGKIWRVAASGGRAETVWESTSHDGDLILRGPLAVIYEKAAPERTGADNVSIVDLLNKRTLASFQPRQGTWFLLSSATADATRFYAVATDEPHLLMSVSLVDGSTRVLDRSQAQYSVSFSSDGRRIAAATQVDGRGTLAVMNADGSSRREFRLPVVSGLGSSPLFSPDGTHLAFITRPPNQPNELVLIDLQSVEERVLARGARLQDVRWRRDGHALRYVALEDPPGPTRRAIHEVMLEGGDRLLRLESETFRMGRGPVVPVNDSMATFFSRERIEFVPLPRGDRRLIFTGPHGLAYLSPDSRFLAVTTVNSVTPRYRNAITPWIEQSNAVAIVDTHTNAQRVLPLNFQSGGMWTDLPVWHPDGRNLLMVGSEPNQARAGLYLVPLNGDRPRRITSLGVIGRQHLGALSPDGKTALVSVPEPIRSDFLEFTLPGATPGAPSPRRK